MTDYDFATDRIRGVAAEEIARFRPQVAVRAQLERVAYELRQQVERPRPFEEAEAAEIAWRGEPEPQVLPETLVIVTTTVRLTDAMRDYATAVAWVAQAFRDFDRTGMRTLGVFRRLSTHPNARRRRKRARRGR